MHTRSLKQCIVLVLLLWLLSGCSPAAPAAPTAPPPTAPPPPTPTAVAPAVTAPTTPPPTAIAQAPAAPAGQQIIDSGRIQFTPDTTRWYTNGDLPPATTRRFTISAAKGQQLNIWLTTDPPTTDSSLAHLSVMDANKRPLLVSPEMYFSQVLAEGGDYTIDIVSYTQQPANYTLSIEIPGRAIDPALGMQYDLPDAAVCQLIQQQASQALGVDFRLETRAPFLDEVAGEAGQGCRLTAAGDGNKFASPQSAVATLIGTAGLGWNEQPSYQADGPTGSATALTRDMALMLILAKWEPIMGASCPQDQPISECKLAPEQKAYSIQINLAQYHATFSLDGHWEDPASGFTLDLGQEWKTIYGGHTAVGQGGNKIDSLEVSISGMVQGQGADIQFKSAFTPNTGTARITVVDPNTMTWKIITPPDGEYYLPAEATMVRK